MIAAANHGEHLSTSAGHASMVAGHESMVGGHESMAMAGMSTSHLGHATTNILPDWLGVIGALAFVAILVIHARHALESDDQRRFWHCVHVVMALGMVFMYAPASIDHLDIPVIFWQLAFANAAAVIVAWMLAGALDGHPINVLWLVAALDLAAMAYMWSPSALSEPLTWLLVAYFACQSLLWATNRMQNIDHKVLRGRDLSVTPDGAIIAEAAEPLICFSKLGASMFAMTLGMAYMFAAMQLLT